MSNKLPGCHLANACRSRSKHILQWRYRNEVSLNIFNFLDVLAEKNYININNNNLNNKE